MWRSTFFIQGYFKVEYPGMLDDTSYTTVTVKTVNSFKTKLDMERKMKMGLFLDWSPLDLEAVTEIRSGRPASILQAASKYLFGALVWFITFGYSTYRIVSILSSYKKLVEPDVETIFVFVWSKKERFE